MGVYARYKKDPEGFRKLVELLECTPKDKRQKMIDVGMKEDPDYTEEALKYCMNFQDVLAMSEPELAEVLAKATARIAGISVSKSDQDIQSRFLRCAPPKVAGEIRDYMETEVGLRELGGAQLKMVSWAREAERAGFIKTKRIPTHLA